MTMSKMIFSIISQEYPESTKELLGNVNNQMRGLLLDTQYITAFYSIYNPENQTITISNAGHALPLFYRASKKKVLALDSFGYFVGIADDSVYEEKVLKVEPGDRLFMYTDGITEIKNKEKEEYGENRLAKFIINNPDIKGDEFCDALLNDVESFAKLDYRDDDIAFLNIEF